MSFRISITNTPVADFDAAAEAALAETYAHDDPFSQRSAAAAALQVAKAAVTSPSFLHASHVGCTVSGHDNDAGQVGTSVSIAIQSLNAPAETTQPNTVAEDVAAVQNVAAAQESQPETSPEAVEGTVPVEESTVSEPTVEATPA